MCGWRVGLRSRVRGRRACGVGNGLMCWAWCLAGRGKVGRGFRLVGPGAGKGEGVGLGPVVGFLGRVSVGFGFVFYFLFFSIPKLHPN